MAHPLYLASGRWHTPDTPAVPQPDDALLAWLVYPESLTAALKLRSDGHFRVQVLRQEWETPSPEEAEQLQLARGERALVREVILWGMDQPWVFARSVMPEATLTGDASHLRRLDNRPLGELLFNDPDVHRGPISINRLRLNPASALPEGILAGHLARQAWGRRSTFWLGERPLLVGETFLKDFNPDCAPGRAAPLQFKNKA